LWPARRREGLSSPPTGRSWQSDWTSRGRGLPLPSPRGIVASAEDALPATTAHGTGDSEASASGWDLHTFNAMDPVEVGLAAGLHEFVVAHVAGSTTSACVGPWTLFVDWCASLAVPRCPSPASEMTVALYLRSVVERSKSYGPVKSHSDDIAFYQKVNLFGHLSIRPPAVNMVRQVTARHFGLGARNRKEPFRWDQVVAFALVHGVNSRG